MRKGFVEVKEINIDGLENGILKYAKQYATASKNYIKQRIEKDTGQLANSISIKQTKEKDGFIVYENKKKNTKRKRKIAHLVEQQGNAKAFENAQKKYEPKFRNDVTNLDMDSNGNIKIKN